MTTIMSGFGQHLNLAWSWPDASVSSRGPVAIVVERRLGIVKHRCTVVPRRTKSPDKHCAEMRSVKDRGHYSNRPIDERAQPTGNSIHPPAPGGRLNCLVGWGRPIELPGGWARSAHDAIDKKMVENTCSNNGRRKS